MTDIEYGDVIFVERDLGYRHFGVYSGNKKVIHYVKDSSESPFDGIIDETSLSRFLDGDRNCYVCNFDKNGRRVSENRAIVPSSVVPGNFSVFDMFKIAKGIYDLIVSEEGKLYSPEETVERARSKIGCGGYDPVFNNCEHFAIWCKTGIEKSEQIEEVIAVLVDSGRKLFVSSR